MGEGLAVRNEDRAQNWFQVIQECRDSGLTNREFCRQRGIPEKKFYYWLRKLRTQALEAAQPQIVPISPGAVAEDVLQIHFRGADLRLPGTVDLDAVAAVLRSIQCRLRVHRSAPRDRRTGGYCHAAIWRTAE